MIKHANPAGVISAMPWINKYAGCRLGQATITKELKKSGK